MDLTARQYGNLNFSKTDKNNLIFFHKILKLGKIKKRVYISIYLQILLFYLKIKLKKNKNL